MFWWNVTLSCNNLYIYECHTVMERNQPTNQPTIIMMVALLIQTRTTTTTTATTSLMMMMIMTQKVMQYCFFCNNHIIIINDWYSIMRHYHLSIFISTRNSIYHFLYVYAHFFLFFLVPNGTNIGTTMQTRYIWCYYVWVVCHVCVFVGKNNAKDRYKVWLCVCVRKIVLFLFFVLDDYPHSYIWSFLNFYEWNLTMMMIIMMFI